MGESQGDQEPHHGEKEGMQNGDKRMDSTVKEGKFQGREGGQAKTTSVGEVGESISV